MKTTVEQSGKGKGEGGEIEREKCRVQVKRGGGKSKEGGANQKRGCKKQKITFSHLTHLHVLGWHFSGSVLLSGRTVEQRQSQLREGLRASSATEFDSE
ncbi:hypothetical protein VNO80_01512 [Phaseolus coccineus]|uniref:Uncharacterized protein n=1 Tax=Phaseolus coccineus TaxID=3886 RepID=A0AAN9RSY2_PHACN